LCAADRSLFKEIATAIWDASFPCEETLCSTCPLLCPSHEECLRQNREYLQEVLSTFIANNDIPLDFSAESQKNSEYNQGRSMSSFQQPTAQQTAKVANSANPANPEYHENVVNIVPKPRPPGLEQSAQESTPEKPFVSWELLLLFTTVAFGIIIAYLCEFSNPASCVVS